MSSGVVDIAAGLATGGLYNVGKAAASGKVFGAGGLGPGGVLTGGVLGKVTQKPTIPGASVGPTAPSLSDAAKQAALDEQKRQQGTSPSPITNIRGASGILTDPNARYVKSQLLGGA